MAVLDAVGGHEPLFHSGQLDPKLSWMSKVSRMASICCVAAVWIGLNVFG